MCIMSSRFVRPETEKLDISGGDWLLVKRRLTAGEQRHAFSRIVKRMSVGEKTELDPEGMGLSKITAYLLDWSLRDDAGVVVIRDQSTAVVEAALLGLDPDSFREIYEAISAHEDRQLAALEEEKKTRDGERRLSVISGSAS
jgi:hypothetical protein